MLTPQFPSPSPSPTSSSRYSSFFPSPASQVSGPAWPMAVSTAPFHSENRCIALAPPSAIPLDRTSSAALSPGLPPSVYSPENSPAACPVQSRAASRTGSSQPLLSSPPPSAKSHPAETQTSSQSRPRCVSQAP